MWPLAPRVAWASEPGLSISSCSVPRLCLPRPLALCPPSPVCPSKAPFSALSLLSELPLIWCSASSVCLGMSWMGSLARVRTEGSLCAVITAFPTASASSVSWGLRWTSVGGASVRLSYAASSCWLAELGSVFGSEWCRGERVMGEQPFSFFAGAHGGLEQEDSVLLRSVLGWEWVVGPGPGPSVEEKASVMSGQIPSPVTHHSDQLHMGLYSLDDSKLVPDYQWPSDDTGSRPLAAPRWHASLQPPAPSSCPSLSTICCVQGHDGSPTGLVAPEPASFPGSLLSGACSALAHFRTGPSLPDDLCPKNVGGCLQPLQFASGNG